MRAHFPSLLCAGVVLAGCGAQQDEQPNATASLVAVSAQQAGTVQVAPLTSRRFAMHRAAYAIANAGGVLSVTELATGVGVTLAPGTARLQFADGTLALDIDGAGGAVYRIYQAAFDREPDPAGYAFWLHSADTGSAIEIIASRFIASDEFRKLYGAAPGNGELLTRMYQHILHRTPDKAGFDFWLSALDSKIVTPAVLLAQFSDSAENKARVLPAIGSGIWIPAPAPLPPPSIDALFAVKGKVVAVDVPPVVQMNYFCGNSGGVCRASLFCKPDEELDAALDASMRFTLDAGRGIATIYLPDKTAVGSFNVQSGVIHAEVSHEDTETPLGNSHKFFSGGSTVLSATIDPATRQMAGTIAARRTVGWTLNSAVALCSATTAFTAAETTAPD